MPKITEFAEDISISGTELIYVVDGSTDKHAVLNSAKSIFTSSIANLTTLKAYEGLSDNQVINLIGGSADGDGLEGAFYWDATSIATADDIDVVQVTAVTTGRWLRMQLRTKYETATGGEGYGVVPYADPTGSVKMFAGSSAPSGYLICNGAAVSRSTYADLFAVISVLYGVGDGSTTFNLPNLVDRSPIGIGSTYTLSQKAGAATHQLTENEMPSHVHAERSQGYVHDGVGSNAMNDFNGGLFGEATQPTGGDAPHNNVHPVLGLNFIIKT